MLSYLPSVSYSLTNNLWIDTNIIHERITIYVTFNCNYVYMCAHTFGDTLILSASDILPLHFNSLKEQRQGILTWFIIIWFWFWDAFASVCSNKSILIYNEFYFVGLTRIERPINDCMPFPDVNITNTTGGVYFDIIISVFNQPVLYTQSDALISLKITLFIINNRTPNNYRITHFSVYMGIY